MEDRKILVSEKTLEKAFCKLRILMVHYQSKSGQTSNPERGQHWLDKAKEVDDLMTAIAKAMDEADEAEYQAMWGAEEQED